MEYNTHRIQNLERYNSDCREVSASFKGVRTVSARSFYQHIGKRIFDVAFVIIGTIFILPVLIVIAVLIKMDGGPIFYSQERLGKSGRIFRFWKFRSMEPKADEQLADHLRSNPKAAIEWNASQKLRHDPRVTPVGRFIRKSSLDELPQIWNVLIGDMSIVGPRPMLPNQRSMYPGEPYENQLPGITGLWQVSERNNVSFAARASYDSIYARDISFWNDIKILLGTVRVVISCTGC